MDFLREKPLRSWLQERTPLIERPKLVDKMPTFQSVMPVPLPAGVTPEQAQEVLARTNWARGLCAGLADVGNLPQGEDRVKYIRTCSEKVAASIFKSSYSGMEVPARKGPGRPPGTGKPRKKPVRVGKEISREELEATTKK